MVDPKLTVSMAAAQYWPRMRSNFISFDSKLPAEVDLLLDPPNKIGPAAEGRRIYSIHDQRRDLMSS